MSAAAQLDRSIIESIVRQIVLAQGGDQQRAGATGASETAKPNLVVSISARHCHLTDEHVEILFGPGAKLMPEKPLYQDGFYAAEQTVMVVGPRRRMLPTVRVLGPDAIGQPGGAGVHRRDFAGHRRAGAAQRQHQGHARLRAGRPEGRRRAARRRDSRRAARSHEQSTTPSTTA